MGGATAMGSAPMRTYAVFVPALLIWILNAVYIFPSAPCHGRPFSSRSIPLKGGKGWANSVKRYGSRGTSYHDRFAAWRTHENVGCQTLWRSSMALCKLWTAIIKMIYLKAFAYWRSIHSIIAFAGISWIVHSTINLYPFSPLNVWYQLSHSLVHIHIDPRQNIYSPKIDGRKQWLKKKCLSKYSIKPDD